MKGQKRTMRRLLQVGTLFLLLIPASKSQAQNPPLQQVEGFDSIVFSHDQQRNGTLTRSSIEFRGQHSGGWTAPWWAPGAMKNNTLVWKTALCPEKKQTLFSFAGASSATPPEFSKGPHAKLFVNDRYVLTFELGV